MTEKPGLISEANSGHDEELAASPLFYPLVAVLMFAPLYKAGNRPFPLLVLEFAAVGILFVIFVMQRALPTMPRLLTAAVGILLIYPLIQMLPLPEAWWRALPGHAEYADEIDRFAADVVKQGMVSVSRTLSLVPSATEKGWLALLPPLACLFAVLRLPVAAVPKLLLTMGVFAGLEGLLGLLQASGGGNSTVYRPDEENLGVAMGTFVNPDHLAGMLSMMVPVIVGLLVYSGRRGRRHRKHRQHGAHRPHHEPPRPFDMNRFSQRALLFASIVLILPCIVLTQSRAGAATGFIALAWSATLLTRMPAGLKQRTLAVLGVLWFAAALALAIDVTPILEKFRTLSADAAGRWLLTVQTIRAALVFLPFGSGLSTMEDVFPRFQNGALAGGINYAHNDYAQAFMELGLVAPVVVALLLIAYAMRMGELLRRERAHSIAILQLAAGMGLLPMILHSAFDFGLHMPANAVWFATLTGVTFHRGARDHERANSDAASSHDRL